MPQLVPPDPRVRASFAAAMDEFRAEGRGVGGDQSEIGHYLRDRQGAWSSDETFRAFVEGVRALRLEETPRLTGTSPPRSSGGSTAASSWAASASAIG
jgi:hypothetical protein